MGKIVLCNHNWILCKMSQNINLSLHERIIDRVYPSLEEIQKQKIVFTFRLLLSLMLGCSRECYNEFIQACSPV